MYALRKLEDGPGLSLEKETPRPPIGSRDVLIQVTHAGICGTDRHIYEWDKWSQNRVKVGITTGHEFVGEVVEVGEAVTRISTGQRVSAEGHITCGYCYQCRTGNAHICETVEIIGIDRDGCFAEYIAIPEENVWPVHEKISDSVAAVFDPLGNAVHTVMTPGVSGKTVLITGVGTIGLMAVGVAKAAGASKIFAVDVDRRRLELAKHLGADLALHSIEDDWIESLQKETGGRGADVLLEMCGHPTVINQGFTALANGGQASLLGIPSGEISIDLSKQIIFKGVTIYGINGRRMFDTWYQMESLLISGKLNIDPIITHQLPMEEFQRGFELMQKGEAIKVVLNIPQTF